MGDVVILIEDEIIPSRWPLAKVIKTHPGQDGIVHAVDIKTSKGTYRQPAHKLAALVPTYCMTDLLSKTYCSLRLAGLCLCLAFH